MLSACQSLADSCRKVLPFDMPGWFVWGVFDDAKYTLHPQPRIPQTALTRNPQRYMFRCHSLHVVRAVCCRRSGLGNMREYSNNASIGIMGFKGLNTDFCITINLMG